MASTIEPHKDQTLARCARRAANRSQREVAEAVGIDRVALSRIERGLERPRESVRARLALALDINPGRSDGSAMSALPEAVTDRLARLAGTAEEATDALDLRDGERELARLRREPQRMTTEMGLRLAEIAAARRSAQRAARAQKLRAMPNLATAEIDARNAR